MSRDLRRYRRQTNLRLLVGFILIFLIGGALLVWLIYGAGALPTFFLCAGAGLAPLILIGLVLGLIQWLADRG